MRKDVPREADARTVVANLGVLLLGGPGSSRRLIENGFFFSEVPFGLKSKTLSIVVKLVVRLKPLY